jgi:adenosylcobinamide kinase/adenosylcobinamide-phosphate guanylyltransferase
LHNLGKPVVVVTNEVGWGVVPETPLGRLFRDAAGRANQVAARQAQEVVLMVSGLPIVVKHP